MWASGLSSSLEAYFTPEEAVLVEIFTGEPSPADLIITDNSDFTYSYTVMDRKGNILQQEDHAPRKPEVLSPSSSVYGLLTQTGTGLSTNWAVFFDVETGQVSETFRYVLISQEDYVVYVNYEEGNHSLVVQNIFDPTVYYEVYELETNIPLPSIDYKYTSSGKLVVTYPTDENQTEAQKEIPLP